MIVDSLCILSHGFGVTPQNTGMEHDISIQVETLTWDEEE